MNSSDVLKKLIEDTESDKIKWVVTIENELVKSIFEKELTPNKKVVFKIVYYNQHPKSTKLYVYFNKKDNWGSTTLTIMDIGGNKKRNEARIVSQLLNKILLKEEKLRNEVDIELDDEFAIGDRVVVIKEQDFQKDVIVGQKGIIVNQFNKDGLKFLVEFDDKFSYLLINNDFNYEINDKNNIKSGQCWLMDPNNIRKIGYKKSK